MPNINNAIPGVPSISRMRKKKQRQAQEAIPNLPKWLTTWEKSQVDAYLDGLDYTNVNVMKAKDKKIAEALRALVDYLGLYQPEDD